ncbi:Alkanesulfonate monooxygenase [Methylocella silvestris BL2]|uniref:Alkanesulfonate monooxygenase n=1 Tax=Methylocella silvestris (strain DSM 15510 / CIP 108128 / LMG 27833 / NCIMB 13906 / BL2) TaxID=395965 RepID=B8EQA1_METSB|nr:LLM class flavin-dependent oxidoreductase [Methylocella silvestris]ACK51591.1 Alkanesulfonate monooxygenase [Methylocella silvestris BL2]
MSVEFIGMIQPRKQSEIHPADRSVVLDRGYLQDFAHAHEAGGFDRALIGYYSDTPDGLLLGGYIAEQTTRLGLLIAHRPGFVAPPVAARAFATLDQLSGGRAAIHVISGGDDADQRRDGDYLDKDARYARTEEYIEILRSIWGGDAPVSHAGRYYRFEAASPAVRTARSQPIPIYFGGASDAAVAVAARQADVFALWGETRAQVAEITGRVRATAARAGRVIRFSLSFRPILADTEAQAWARAEKIRETIIAGKGEAWLGRSNGEAPVNEGSRRLLAAAALGDRLDNCLWTGAAALTGARGNTTALVGTPHQVAEALLDYWRLGVSTFLLRGFDPLEDAIDYGERLIPLTRALIAAEQTADHTSGAPRSLASAAASF